MDSDWNLLLHVQPALNPWVVVLLGSIAGLFTFAVSSAMHVRHSRNRPSSTAAALGKFALVRRIVVVSTLLFGAFMLARAVPGPTLVDARGWLSGEDLFTVSARPGFIATYPSRTQMVEQGEVILHLVRDAGPEEIAAGIARRDLLLQDLEFARLEPLRIDPLLLREYEDAAEQMKALQSARHELQQVASSLKAAVARLEVTQRPDAKGAFSADEVSKRIEQVEVLRSRQAELRERIALLSGEEPSQVNQFSLTSSRQQDVLLKAQARLDRVTQAIEQDKQRAERQRQHRIQQIELQIKEIDELLNPQVGALEVRAPWNGIVGFREPSPASVRGANSPILVLYRPGTVAARVRVPPEQAAPAVGDAVDITMHALVAGADGAFKGTITQSQRYPDGSTELLIAGDPPELAIRALVYGNPVPVHTNVRRTNPMAHVSPSVWAAGAVVLGIILVALRARAARRRTMAGDEVGGHQRLNWGGDTEEYLEFVTGAGIVPRRLHGEHPPLRPVEELRRVRQVAPSEMRGSA